MSKPHALLIGFLIWFNLTPAALAVSLTPDDMGGRVEAEVGGRKIIFPTLKSDIDVDIQGDLATVTLVQTFANPLQEPLHATYLFPMNKEAAVYEMTMAVGEEIVQAKIRKVEEARRTFETAKGEGKSAALLTQHRPNMFTQDIANLMPGLPIKVTLRYVQTVPKIDGAYELVLPLVVGPRFQPPEAGIAPMIEDGMDNIAANIGNGGSNGGGVPRWNPQAPPPLSGGALNADSGSGFGQWEMEQLPDYPPVSGLEIPGRIDAERVSLKIKLDGGMPIGSVASATHAIDSEEAGPRGRTITLAGGRTIDNRDFVLHYTLAGATNQAGLLSYRDQRGGFFSLLIEPPASPADNAITPREMVFVLDCSGSMGGLPMTASKTFMRQALSKLRPNDSFRIIRFSDAATEFSSRPLAATPANIRSGINYTEQLRGGGGTMMSSGIRQALQVPEPAGTLRIVVFLTDGYIGNEFEVLRLIKNSIGAARLYAFGVGTGVNRFLLSEMGRIGRGFTRYMDPSEDVESVTKELTDRLQSPVLTDIAIDWGELAPTALSPEQIPDLFAGQSLRVQGRYQKPGDYRIRVEGKVNGRHAALPLNIHLPEQSESGEAVALVWARSAVNDAMHGLITPQELRPGRTSDDALKQRVIQLGLDFSLTTQWTAFVAVSKKVYNSDPQDTPTLPVLLPQVKGVGPGAYGQPPASAFTGNAAPEPETLFGMALMALLFGGFVWQRPNRKYLPA